MNSSQQRLGDQVTHFKGRAISSKLEPGLVHIINISDISASGIIDYTNLKTADLTEKQYSRYLLEERDVLITSKGTVKKVAVYEQQNYPTIASANITILRPNDTIRGYYIKLFLDSKEGRRQLDKADNGQSVINLSTDSLLDIEIPSIPLVKQDYMISRYLQGLGDFQRKISRAEQEWQRIQDDINRQLF